MVQEGPEGLVKVPVLAFPMPSGEPAILAYEDGKRIVEDLGFSDQFFLHHNGKKGSASYVATSHPDTKSKVHCVARVVIGAVKGTNVFYNTADRRNLLRDNLRMGKGYSKGHEAQAIRAAEPF